MAGMSKTLSSVVAAAVLLLVVLAGPAHAGFAPADAIAEHEAIENTAVAVDRQGNSLVVWDEDGAATGGNAEVKGRLVAASGVAGPELDISPSGEKGAGPTVTFAGNGRALVAWEAYATGTTRVGVKARWVEPDGSLGPIVTLADGGPSVDARYLESTVDPVGTATILWRNSADGKLPARRVEQDNTLYPLVPDAASGMSGNGVGVISALPDGSTLVVIRGPKASVISVNGTVSTPVPLPVSGGTHGDGALATTGDGESLVVWQQRDPATMTYSVKGRLLDAGGAPVGGELDVRSPGTNFLSTPRVAADSAGDFLAAWRDSGGADAGRIFARRLDADGNYAGAAQPVSQNEGDAFEPVPALEDGGSGMVAWVKNGVAQGLVLDPFAIPVGDVSPALAAVDHLEGAHNPASGLAAFAMLNEDPTGDDTLHLGRSMPPPACSDSDAGVVHGGPITATVSCSGLAIEAVELVEPPRHGTSSASGPGLAFEYTPLPNFSGTDSFTYRAVNDGGASNVATVRIRVEDRVKPTITRLRLRKKDRRFALQLRYSEPSTGRVSIKRRAPGGRYRLVGTVSAKQLAGSARLRVSGRLRKRFANGGRFRVSAVATDAAGNTSTPRRLAIRIETGGR